jgi:putative membrane protein
MSDIIEKLFDPDARERVANAVMEAERGTSGEIVPCVVEQSDEYEESLWLASLVGAGIAIVAIAIIDIVVGPWGSISLAGFALIVASAAAAAGLIAAFSMPIRVLFAGRATVDRRTQQAAIAAFVSEQVFATRERTGILIFLSLRERRVIVLGDAGINDRVDQSAWDGTVRAIVDGIRRGHPVDALVEAIARCGRILSEAGCVLAPDDTNELPDTLRVAASSKRPRRS